jgi:hypothetical protein
VWQPALGNGIALYIVYLGVVRIGSIKDRRRSLRVSQPRSMLDVGLSMLVGQDTWTFAKEQTYHHGLNCALVSIPRGVSPERG